MAYTVTGLPRFQLTLIENTFFEGFPVNAGQRIGSSVRINLPSNLQITNSDTQEWCPSTFLIGDFVSAIGPDMNGEYVLIDGAKTVELKTLSCQKYKTETQSSTGPAGEKGEKGNSGTGSAGEKGDVGEKGESGEKGSVGSQGSKGQPGEKGEGGDEGPKGGVGSTGGTGPKGEIGIDGSQGDQGDTGNTGNAGSKGEPGEKGSKGEGLDWNDTQQSILIGGTKFGPRLIGVCQNGTYKYVYVFASDPTS